MTKEELEQILVKGSEVIINSWGEPDSLWVPKYGWVVLEGKRTEAGERFAGYLKKLEEKVAKKKRRVKTVRTA